MITATGSQNKPKLIVRIMPIYIHSTSLSLENEPLGLRPRTLKLNGYIFRSQYLRNS